MPEEINDTIAEIYQRVYRVVAQIPAGRVLTYQKVAELAGAKNARVVGTVLHRNPNPEEIPCYRVVRSDGCLAEGYMFGGTAEQRKKLEAEGIVFNSKGEIDLARFAQNRADLGKKAKLAAVLVITLAAVGLADTAFLTYQHYRGAVVFCPTYAFSFFGRYLDCRQVLQSPWATISGIPLSLFGAGYYLVVSVIALTAILRRNRRLLIHLLLPLSALGLGVSLLLLYLQLFVIGAICLYCTVSGAINLSIFILSLLFLSKKLFVTDNPY